MKKKSIFATDQARADQACTGQARAE